MLETYCNICTGASTIVLVPCTTSSTPKYCTVHTGKQVDEQSIRMYEWAVLYISIRSNDRNMLSLTDEQMAVNKASWKNQKWTDHSVPYTVFRYILNLYSFGGKQWIERSRLIGAQQMKNIFQSFFHLSEVQHDANLNIWFLRPKTNKTLPLMTPTIIERQNRFMSDTLKIMMNGV